MPKPRKKLTPAQARRVRRAGDRARRAGRDPKRARAAALGAITRKRNKRSVAATRGHERRRVAEETRRKPRGASEPGTYAPAPLDSGGLILYAAPRVDGIIDADAAFGVLSDLHGALLGAGASTRNTRGEKLAPLITRARFAALPDGLYTVKLKLEAWDLSAFAEDADDAAPEPEKRYTESRQVTLTGDNISRARALLDVVGAAMRAFTSASYVRDQARAQAVAILVSEIWLYPA
jgi:hypothetical protein